MKQWTGGGDETVKQRKPWVTTLVLVGIAAALAAYIFLVEAKREPPPVAGVEALPTPAPLWEFGPDDVAGIAVTRGEQTTAVEREDGAWRVTAPEEGEADSARMGGLAFVVAEMRFTRVIADASNLADFGLEEPEVQVTLVLSDGTTVDLGIGSENPRGDARYVQKEGDALVYLVARYDVDELLRLVDDPPYPPTPVPTQSPLLTPTVKPEPSPVPTETEEPETPTATSEPRPTPTPSS